MRAAVVCVALLATPVPASGHSLLLESSPAANAEMSTPPTQVALRFNNRIEKGLSRVRLIGPDGAAMQLPADSAGTPDRLVTAAPSLAAGRYRVEWQVLSSDGHVVTGAFSFTVGP
jgi:methionine-rich copper-binding protein CopC